MKILYVGYHNPLFPSITEYVENAVRGLGHTLLSFDDRRYYIPGIIRRNIPALERMELQRINRQVLFQAKRYAPELCIVHGGLRIFPETIAKLKALNISTVLWTSDVPWSADFLVANAAAYDFVFCGGTEAVEILHKAGNQRGRWLAFACDPQVHRPVALSEKERRRYGADIVFVGSVHPDIYAYRIQVLTSIADMNLKIWGPGAQCLEDPRLRALVQGSDTKPEEWVKIYSAANIGLCMHYRDPRGKIPCYQVSPRVYEILACRCFLLVDRQNDLTGLFEDGKHCVIFNDENDLRTKITYYLQHPEERRRIAEQGYAEVMRKHTYTHRVQEMLRIVKGES